MRVEYNPEFGETFISMWSRPNSFPWLTRLRHIWEILTGGEPFDDEIILNRECMAKLSGYLAKSVGRAGRGGGLSICGDERPIHIAAEVYEMSLAIEG